MSTLKVVGLQNPASGIVNGTLNSDGTTTFAGTVTFASGQTFPSAASTLPPSSPSQGSTWYDTGVTPAQLKVWNGSAWVPVANNQSGTAPTAPTTGQQWTDTSTVPPVLKLWNGSAWVPASVAISNGVAPTSPVTGQLWSDTSTTPATLKAFNGTTWVPVQAAGGGGSGTVTSVSGTAPIAVATGTTTPVVSITAGTARQLLQTNAGGTAAEFTSNVDIPGTLDVTGVATFDGIASHPLGTAAAPSVTFTGDTNTGLYSPGADQVAMVTNGADRLTASTTAVTSTLPIVAPLGAVATPSLTFTGDLDTGFYSPGAGRVGIANNGVAKLEVSATGDILVGGTLPGTPNAQITTAGQVIGTSYNGGQLAGFRNLLINGNFAINQRGYVSGTATAAANEYTLDRWKVLVLGQNLTFAASGNGNQITAPAGGVQQVIEAGNVGGGTYTLSWTGTATAAVNGTAATNGSQVTLPANTQATVTFTGGTVSNAQLEPGTKATPFEQRMYGTELVLCQRYCNKWQLGPRDTRWWTERDANTNAFLGVCELTVPLRTFPTSATFGDAANWNIYTGASYTVTSRFLYAGGGAVTVGMTNVNRVGIGFDSAALATALGGNWQQAPIRSNSNTLWPYVIFDAEL